jgi:hypothetical protein
MQWDERRRSQDNGANEQRINTDCGKADRKDDAICIDIRKVLIRGSTYVLVSIMDEVTATQLEAKATEWHGLGYVLSSQVKSRGRLKDAWAIEQAYANRPQPARLLLFSSGREQITSIPMLWL